MEEHLKVRKIFNDSTDFLLKKKNKQKKNGGKKYRAEELDKLMGFRFLVLIK